MLIDKLLYQRQIKRELGLDEDYTSGPWTAPNDTSYVGFFFEKDVNSFPARVRKEYEEIKQAILQREETFREMYGDDWRNVAVFQAYRMMKEAAESYSEAEQISESFEDFWITDKKFEYGKKLFESIRSELVETMKPIEIRVGDEFQVWDPETNSFVFSRKAEVDEENLSATEEDLEESLKGPLSKSDYMPGVVRHDLGNVAKIEADKLKRREYEKKHVKTFIAPKEKDAKDFAKQNGFVVVKHSYPSGHKNMYDYEWHILKEETKLEPKKFSEWKAVKE